MRLKVRVTFVCESPTLWPPGSHWSNTGSRKPQRCCRRALGTGSSPRSPLAGPGPGGKPEAAAMLGPTRLGDGQEELSLPMWAQG